MLKIEKLVDEYSIEYNNIIDYCYGRKHHSYSLDSTYDSMVKELDKVYNPLFENWFKNFQSTMKGVRFFDDVMLSKIHKKLKLKLGDYVAYKTKNDDTILIGKVSEKNPAWGYVISNVAFDEDVIADYCKIHVLTKEEIEKLS